MFSQFACQIVSPLDESMLPSDNAFWLNECRMTQITLSNDTSSKTYCYTHYFMCRDHGIQYMKGSSGLSCLVCKRNESARPFQGALHGLSVSRRKWKALTKKAIKKVLVEYRERDCLFDPLQGPNGPHAPTRDRICA